MLDWDRISELREEVGDAEFQVILEMFLDEVESAMMRLSAKDPKRLETSLHFLKGCAWNLGFAAFGGLCDEEERRAAGGRAVAVRQLHYRALVIRADGAAGHQQGERHGCNGKVAAHHDWPSSEWCSAAAAGGGALGFLRVPIRMIRTKNSGIRKVAMKVAPSMPPMMPVPSE